MQYRMQNGCQQSSYNQPPHVSYYLGSEAPLPERPVVVINGTVTGTVSPAIINTEKAYFLRNLNSNLLMGAEGAPAGGTNISQQSSENANAASLWCFEALDDDYYMIRSAADVGYALTFEGGATANGTNLSLQPADGGDAQQFRLWRKGSGYLIAAKGSNENACVEVKNAVKDVNGNVQLWEKNGHECQTWLLEAARYHAAAAAGFTGDLNNDGKINAVDLTLLKRQLITNAPRAVMTPQDLNADGTVSIADAIVLMKFLTGEGGIEKSYYAAIDAAYYNGVQENTNTGFRETAYVNLDNVLGSYIEFRVFAPETGTYRGTLGTSNGSTANRIMDISVNGGASVQSDFNSTQAWTTWAETALTLNLTAGYNTVRLTSAMDQGGPNIDYLIVERAG
jgi:hypothetical protein